MRWDIVDMVSSGKNTHFGTAVNELDEKTTNNPATPAPETNNVGVVSDSDDLQSPLYGFDAADAGNVGVVSDSSSDDDGYRKVSYYSTKVEKGEEEDLMQYRTWTDNTGVYTTFAQFCSCVDGLVCLAKPPEVGKRLGLVRLERLSVGDRELVGRYMKELEVRGRVRGRSRGRRVMGSKRGD